MMEQSSEGDSWLQAHLQEYVTWAKKNNSLLIITWDEDDDTTVEVRSCDHLCGADGEARRLLTREDYALQRLANVGGDVRVALCGEEFVGDDDYGSVAVDGKQAGRSEFTDSAETPNPGQVDQVLVRGYQCQPEDFCGGCQQMVGGVGVEKPIDETARATSTVEVLG